MSLPLRPGRWGFRLTGALAGLLGLLIPVSAYAGAWVQDPGTAYVRLAGGYLGTDERFDGDGNRVPWDVSGGGFRDAEYQDLALTLYTEVGIARGWNLVASIPWSRIEADQPTATFTTYGFGDFFLAGKRALWSGDGTVSSILAGIGIPGGYGKEDYPALGAGVVEGAFLAQVGHSWGNPWGNFETEFRLRGGDYASQIRWALGGGFSPARRVALRAEARGTVSLVAGDSGEPAPPGDLDDSMRFDPATTDPTFLDLAGTLSVTVLRGWAVEGEVRSTVLGENTLAGTRWSLALATSPAWRFREGGR